MSMTIGLEDVSSYLPGDPIPAVYYRDDSLDESSVMFRAPAFRHHVAEDETGVDMLERAAHALRDRQGARALSNVDVVLSHTQLPDEILYGSSGEFAHRIGARPSVILDVQNGGCVSFVHMLQLAAAILKSTDAKTALIGCVTNVAGSVYTQDRVRRLPQAPIPGDGAGLALVTRTAKRQVLGISVLNRPEYAGDMRMDLESDRRYWQAGTGQMRVAFDEANIREVVRRGTTLVPQAVRELCAQTGTATEQIDMLITNQPNTTFMRGWRRELGVDSSRHPNTFDEHGNLFGAAIPIVLDQQIRADRLAEDDLVVLAGFAHAGDYAAAAGIRWHK